MPAAEGRASGCTGSDKPGVWTRPEGRRGPALGSPAGLPPVPGLSRGRQDATGTCGATTCTGASSSTSLDETTELT